MHDDGDIQYNSFTDRELKEAYESINREIYPLNFVNLAAEIDSRPSLADSNLQNTSNRVRSLYEDGAKPNKKTKPITLANLVWGLATCVIFLVLGILGLARDDVVISTRTGVQHLQGLDDRIFLAIIAVGALVYGAKIASWLKYRNERGRLFQFADELIQVVICFYIIYLFFDMFISP
jgi:hypothetical protein